MIAFFCFIATAFGLVGSAPAYCLAPIAVLLGVYCVCFVCRRAFMRKDFDALMFQGVVFSGFLLFMLLKKETTFLYALLEYISINASALAGSLVGRPISMGVTYSGLDLVCLFLIAVVVDCVFLRRCRSLRSIARFAAARFAVVFLIWGFYIAFWTVLAENSLSLGLGFLEPLTGPLDYRALLFVLLSAAHAVAHGKGRRERAAAPAAPAGQKAKAGVAAATALCALLFLLSFIGPAAPETPEGERVLFWDSGIDFSLPENGRYGLDNAGMFGFLPRYLETKGYDCSVTDLPDEDALDAADVLVIINPMSMPDAESLAAILEFTRRGGGLLAVGDHTGDAQIRLPLNAVLAPAGISFNFDSATPFKSLWADEFITRRSPVFAGVADEQIQVVVGASLEISRGARPLLIGRCGYSDAGDPENAADGFLGDRQFNRGERVGDLILAASAEYGKGRIAAFGDTSFLQNLSIAYSHPLIDNLFAWLAGDASKDLRAAGDAAGDDGDAAGGDAAGHSDGDGGGTAGDARGGAPVFTASCILDAAHMPSFNIDKSGDAADGFIASALRAGLTPYVNRRPSLAEAMDRAGDLRLIALVEPALSLSARDLSALDDFVEDGGALLLFGTYRSPQATRELFAHFGFSFERVPIGRVSPDMVPDMAFWNACPLLYDGRPAATSGDVESLIEIWGYSVTARRELGSGSVCVFGDADFIKNKNLENVETYRKGNVDFVDELLRDAVARGPRGARDARKAGSEART
jgi:hypothetical protein